MTISYSKPVAVSAGVKVSTASADGTPVAQVAISAEGEYAVRIIEGDDAFAWHKVSRLVAREFVIAAADTL